MYSILYIRELDKFVHAVSYLQHIYSIMYNNVYMSLYTEYKPLKY